nr:hypothetical protein GCM10020092_076470 [Actinoplanes digitatis]
MQQPGIVAEPAGDLERHDGAQAVSEQDERPGGVRRDGLGRTGGERVDGRGRLLGVAVAPPRHRHGRHLRGRGQRRLPAQVLGGVAAGMGEAVDPGQAGCSLGRAAEPGS